MTCAAAGAGTRRPEWYQRGCHAVVRARSLEHLERESLREEGVS